MHGLDPIDGDGDGTVFRDVIMLALLGFVTIVILLLPHLNPPTKHDAAADPPGNVVVEIRWPDENDADVDLWVQAPGDVPVGYSNKDGGVFNLLRDDLGHIQDLSSLNYEMAYSRGTPEGEYTVNLHLYRSRTTPLPIPVEVNIGIRKTNSESLVTVASNRVQLSHEGEELTVVRFRLSRLGRLVNGSMHALPRILRNVGG